MCGNVSPSILGQQFRSRNCRTPSRDEQRIEKALVAGQVLTAPVKSDRASQGFAAGVIKRGFGTAG